MIKNIIFDLSEVIISGYYGVEKIIEQNTYIPAEDFLKRKKEVIEIFLDTMRGKYSEDEYVQKLISETNWNITGNQLKNLIRENLNIPVNGMLDLLKKLQGNYKLILLSDHVREWVEYIFKNNTELDVFEYKYFSYEVGKLKSDGGTFKYILESAHISANETIFIDDSKTNVEIACKNGIDGIVFSDIEQLKNDLIKRGIVI